MDPQLSTTIRVRARWVFPSTGPPMDGGRVTLRDDRVVSVERSPGPGRAVDLSAALGSAASKLGSATIDLGDVALLPGLVNAHVHLDFSELAAPLGRPGAPFVEWIREVLRWKRAEERDLFRSEAAGLAECRGSGATLLGEIAQAGRPPDRPPQVRRVRFRELIGVGPERTSAALAAAIGFLQPPGAADQRADVSTNSRPDGEEPDLLGLSPHAPYTVSTGLLEGAVALARERGVPLAMHLAESPEELELLGNGGGPFRELLEELGAWTEGALAVGRRPLWFLERLAAAERSLVIHGNFLDDAEMEFLAERRDRMTLAHCPRTHSYFGREPFPLAKVVARGVRVALGTDGRGSNPDLDILAEVRQAARLHPQISPDALLRMITSDAADGLGLGEQYGRLAVGWRGEPAVAPLAARVSSDPYAALMESVSPARPLTDWLGPPFAAAPR